MVDAPFREFSTCISRLVEDSRLRRNRLIGELGFVGARFPRPTGWETQPLSPNAARCGLTNPQHRGIIPCFLKQVLRHRTKIFKKDITLSVKIQYPYSYHRSTLPSKYLTTAIVLCLLILLVPSSFAAPKRVVVLYFEDHSRFDHPTGCGCIPTGPFGKFFGGRKGHTRWHLKEGFTEILNRKLGQSEVYEPVSQDELLDAMAESGLSRRGLRSDPEKRAQLAKTLKVQALIVGDIRKFNQERVKANAGRLIRQGGQGYGSATASYVCGVQLMGSLYVASIPT